MNLKKHQQRPLHNFLLTHKAFSIIQVLIAMSLLTTFGYFMADMIVSQQKSISSSESRMEKMEIIHQARMLLRDKGACEKTLAGNSGISPPRDGITLDTDSNGGYTKKNISSIRDRNDMEVFLKNKLYGNGSIKITKLGIQNNSPKDSTGSSRANLFLSMKINKGNLKNVQIEESIPLTVTTDSTGKITECFAKGDITETVMNEIQEQIARQTCDMIGGQYNTDGTECQTPADAEIACQDLSTNPVCQHKYGDASYKCFTFGVQACPSPTTLRKVSKPSPMFFPKLRFGCYGTKACKDYIASMPDYLTLTKSFSLGNGKPIPNILLGKSGKVKKGEAVFSLTLKQPIPFDEYIHTEGHSIEYEPKPGLSVGANLNFASYTGSTKPKYTQQRYTTACCKVEDIPSAGTTIGRIANSCLDMGGKYDYKKGTCMSPYKTEFNLSLELGGDCTKSYKKIPGSGWIFTLKCANETLSCPTPRSCLKEPCTLQCPSGMEKKTTIGRITTVRIPLKFECRGNDISECRGFLGQYHNQANFSIRRKELLFSSTSEFSSTNLSSKTRKIREIMAAIRSLEKLSVGSAGYIKLKSIRAIDINLISSINGDLYYKPDQYHKKNDFYLKATIDSTEIEKDSSRSEKFVVTEGCCTKTRTANR